jgi:hypothetical protein
MADAPALNVWEYPWHLDVEQCPCDVHLIEWLDDNGVTDSAIYHFGTGSHHAVGIACADPKRRNAVLGITANTDEHRAFVDLVLARPDVLRHYNVVFGDIYLINPGLLPAFDVVTLFHLCEFRSERTDAYGGLTDREVLDILTAKTRPGGHILFFSGSFAFDDAKRIVARWETEAPVERVGDFKSLLVYRKR